MTGFAPEAAFGDNVSRHGHMGSVDILCNVADAAGPDVGAIYALGTSYTAFSMLRMTPTSH